MPAGGWLRRLVGASQLNKAQFVEHRCFAFCVAKVAELSERSQWVRSLSTASSPRVGSPSTQHPVSAGPRDLRLGLGGWSASPVAVVRSPLAKPGRIRSSGRSVYLPARADGWVASNHLVRDRCDCFATDAITVDLQ